MAEEKINQNENIAKDEEGRVVTRNANILCVLRILEKYTDADHPLTQEQIAEKIAKEFSVLQKSQRLMIKDRLVSAHDYFCTKGSIGKYSLETLEELYGEYGELGGNGFIKTMMNDIRELMVK